MFITHTMYTKSCTVDGCTCTARGIQIAVYRHNCTLCDHSPDGHVKFCMQFTIPVMQRIFTAGHLRRRDQHAVKSTCRLYAYARVIRSPKSVISLHITSAHREKYGPCAICQVRIRTEVRNPKTGHKRKKVDYAPTQIEKCRCWVHLKCLYPPCAIVDHLLCCPYRPRVVRYGKI